MAGDTLGKPSRFAFVEFSEIDGAKRALALTGQMLADRRNKIYMS